MKTPFHSPRARAVLTAACVQCAATIAAGQPAPPEPPAQAPAEPAPEAPAPPKPAEPEAPPGPVHTWRVPGDTPETEPPAEGEAAPGEAPVEGAQPGAPADAEPPPEGPPELGKGPGKVRGTVVDRKTGLPVAGAQIFVHDSSAGAETDAAGRFELDVPAGEHALTIIHIDYLTGGQERVRVRGGAATDVRVALTPALTPADDIVVTGAHIKGGVADVLDKRRNSASVTDAIGSSDISRSADGTASAATRRVVGATIVGGQFLFVRGLGGRYSNVRLNGVPLPSTDPDLPGFQIDLFPASLLSSLTIAKTFTPDIPADFAGGSLNVETRDFPEKLTVTASLATQYNTEATFRERPSYEGGSTDFLGFDDGTRALPETVPNERVRLRDRSNPDGLTPDDLTRIAQGFENNWKLERQVSPPNLGLTLSVGNTHKPGGRKLGYLFTAGYRLIFQRYDETLKSVDLVRGEAVEDDSLQREVGLQQAQIGLLGTASYELAEGHEVRLVSLLTQTGDDTAWHLTGRSASERAPIQATQYQFVERQLFFNQLLGEHLKLLGPLDLNWQVNTSSVKRNEPDTRSVMYRDTGAGFEYHTSPASGEHLFSELDQRDFGWGADATLPLDETKLKAGYLGRVSDREFGARRFGPDYNGPAEGRLLPPEEFFAPDRFGTVLRLTEKTNSNDGYQAEEGLHAGYGMVDTPTWSWLRVMAGARGEAFSQSIDVGTRFAEEVDVPQGVDRTNFDLLPAAALIFGLRDDMNVRLGYGETIARPLVRELAPGLTTDFVRRRTIQGNPDLERTFIHNYDVRWELFPSATEVVAASGFYKSFDGPIETIILNTNGDITYENIDEAQNFGVEIEGRVDLARFSKSLEDFQLGANLAIIRSRVQLTDEQRNHATTGDRPLAGQSPYVANFSIGYAAEDLGLSFYGYYNVFGPRIVEVGRDGIPDAYEQPFHSVDLTGFWEFADGWTLGAAAQNVLAQSVVVKQGDVEISRSFRGQIYGLRLAWEY